MQTKYLFALLKLTDFLSRQKNWLKSKQTLLFALLKRLATSITSVPNDIIELCSESNVKVLSFPSEFALSRNEVVV